MDKLIGKKITGLWINEDQSVLAFDTDKGKIIYGTESECCSKTWFADILGVTALVGGTVHTVEEVSMEGYNVDDGRTRQDRDIAYGYKLTTDKGYVDIVFRNSSNGYYGGDIYLVRGNPPNNMIAITADWHA